MNELFWKNKKVLITGHTGFKGAWLSIWLHRLGAEIVGLSLEPPTKKNIYDRSKIKNLTKSLRGDIRNYSTVEKVIKKYKPEIIFHLAAQAIVLDSYERPLETYETNVIGSMNILEAARQCLTKCSIIMVTSDKCYKNEKEKKMFDEESELGGKDIYSSSKAAAEIMIKSFNESFFQNNISKKNQIKVASVRGGNVIGGGDWSKNRLIPDIIRSISNRKKLNIRNPHSVRPWQYVLDLLHGYLLLAEKLHIEGKIYSGAWNFGPSGKDFKNVEWITKKFFKSWGKEYSYTKKNSNFPEEAKYLMLSSSKAKKRLGWETKYSLKDTLNKISSWHKYEINKNDMLEVSIKDIDEFLLRD